MAQVEVKSEVTGSVWKIITKPGERVAAGAELMILESMKMEIPVLTEDGGTIREFRVAEGEPVSEGQTVAILDT